jgi:phosphatidylserine/phosphatidylglycerophosphate/cardiolipin synthase-like enzyme
VRGTPDFFPEQSRSLDNVTETPILLNKGGRNMSIQIKAYANSDDTFIVWKPDGPIVDCRGFALFRFLENPDGTETKRPVSTWVGFENESPPPPKGTRKYSTEWPIQRFLWTDYVARAGDKVSYQVVPMCGPDKHNLVERWNLASNRTPTLRVDSGQTKGLFAYFNRGIVASQWLSRRLGYVPPAEIKKKLKLIIQDPSSQIRKFLSGELRDKILQLLAETAQNHGIIYGSLYELNDPELIPILKRFGPNLHLILGNGSPSAKKPDPNAVVRDNLRKTSTIDLHDRIVKKPHLAHHKFLVFCDRNDTPMKVWTGSTNWTVTGLCTQANNGLLVDNADIAGWFKDLWKELKDAGNDYPKSLKDDNSKARSVAVGGAVGGAQTSVWFAPVFKEVDLEQARKLIRAAQAGVLFLFFNPGPTKTLLNEILALRDSGLFIHGVANQDPGGKKNPVIRLYDRGKPIPASPKVLLPEAIDETLAYWMPELRNYSLAMVHSKVVVVDPFGAKPIVMTGSHNLGPKASRANDDNLLIIENAPGLAAEYAVNILSIYGQYKWRHNSMAKKGKPSWKGLKDSDAWQKGLFAGPQWQEVLFWMG